MAKSQKFSVRIVRVGTSGSDSIAIALAPNASLKIEQSSKHERGEIMLKSDGAQFWFGLSGWTAGDYKNVRDFADVTEFMEELDQILYIAKATSESAKGGACGSRWERDGGKFSLAVKFYSVGGTVEHVRNVLEFRDNDGALVAVISGFGISSTRLDSWIGSTGPIGKLGKLSNADRLALDIERQKETVANHAKALAAAEKVLADLEAKLPKKAKKAANS